jgi:hypothetical protein
MRSKDAPRQWTPYEIGQRVGLVQILKVVDEGWAQENFYYQIAYTCCGRTAERTHKAIKRTYAGDRNPSQCEHCRKHGNKSRYHIAGGVQCATGWWPKLGKMGPRFGAIPEKEIYD